MGKAILLSRVSTFHQDIDQQTADLYKDAEYLGYKKDQLIVIEDKESAIKLSEEQRNGLNTMKHYIENETVDCVIIWEITRISRQLPMLYSIRDYLQAHKVQLYCHQPQFILFNDDWTISDVSNMVFAMFAVLAENEMNTKKARIKRSRENNKLLGKSSGGRSPFGYTTNKDNYFIVKEEDAIILRRIFTEYSTGLKSMRTICKELQAEGYFPNTKYLTLLCDVNKWLKEEYYTGNDKYPMIISKELFDKCQLALKKNILVKNTYKENIHLLKGLIYDKNNGLLLSCNRASDMYFSKRYKGCSCLRINIDPIVWELAAELYYNIMNDTNTVYNSLMEKMQIVMKKMDVCKNKEQSIQEKIDRVEERLIYGKISEEKANDITEELDKERKNYKQQYNNYLGQSIELQKQIHELLFGDKKSTKGMETIEQKIEIINKTIEKILVNKIKRNTLIIEIFNKINTNIYIYKCDCWKHTFELLQITTMKL